MRPGDVIVAFNGTAIDRPRPLPAAARRHAGRQHRPIGSRVERGGRRVDVKVLVEQTDAASPPQLSWRTVDMPLAFNFADGVADWSEILPRPRPAPSSPPTSSRRCSRALVRWVLAGACSAPIPCRHRQVVRPAARRRAGGHLRGGLGRVRAAAARRHRPAARDRHEPAGAARLAARLRLPDRRHRQSWRGSCCGSRRPPRERVERELRAARAST